MKKLKQKTESSEQGVTIPTCPIKVEPLSWNNANVKYSFDLYKDLPLKQEKDMATNDCTDNISYKRLGQLQATYASTSKSIYYNGANDSRNIPIKLEDNLKNDKKPLVKHNKKFKKRQQKRANLRRNYRRLACSEEKRLKKMLKRGIRSLAPSTLPIAKVKNENEAGINNNNNSRNNFNNNKKGYFIPFTKQQKRNIKKMIAKGMDPDSAKLKEIKRYNHFLKIIAEDMANKVNR